MNTWTVLVEIPNSLLQEAIDCHIIIMNWSHWSIESRVRDVERLEHHIWEIVSAILIKMATKNLRLK